MKHIEAWLAVAGLVLVPVVIVAAISTGMVEQARTDGWPKTLWDSFAVLGIIVLASAALIGLALLVKG